MKYSTGHHITFKDTAIVYSQHPAQGCIHTGQWVKVKEGRLEEVMEQMTAGKQGAQLFKQGFLSKGRREKKGTHNLVSTHILTHTHSQTPLSFNDAMRA